jgi:hypothetical protein
MLREAAVEAIIVGTPHPIHAEPASRSRSSGAGADNPRIVATAAQE